MHLWIDIGARGHMHGSDDQPIQIDEAPGSLAEESGPMFNVDQPSESEDSDAQVANIRNHGARIDGPRAFGMRNGLNCRMLFEERRDRATLVPIIQRESCSTIIHTVASIQ